VGVVLALSCVGKYLFSDNFASFLNYITEKNEVKAAWDDVIALLLLVLTNLVLWVPIKKELMKTSLYKKFCIRRGTGFAEDPEQVDS
jgi:hypothetical protein